MRRHVPVVVQCTNSVVFLTMYTAIAGFRFNVKILCYIFVSVTRAIVCCGVFMCTKNATSGGLLCLFVFSFA